MKFKSDSQRKAVMSQINQGSSQYVTPGASMPSLPDQTKNKMLNGYSDFMLNNYVIDKNFADHVKLLKFKTKQQFWDYLIVGTPVHTRFVDPEFGDKVRMGKVIVHTPTKVQIQSINQPDEKSWIYKHELSSAHVEDDTKMIFDDGDNMKRIYRLWWGYAD